MTDVHDYAPVEATLRGLVRSPDPDAGQREAARATTLALVDALIEAQEPPGATFALRSWLTRLGGMTGAPPWLAQRRGVALVVVLVLALLASSLGAGTAVADAAKPGESLYSLDLFIEDARLKLAPTDQQRASLQIDYAQERLAETADTLDDVVDDDASAALAAAITSLETLLGQGDLSPRMRAEVEALLEALVSRRAETQRESPALQSEPIQIPPAGANLVAPGDGDDDGAAAESDGDNVEDDDRIDTEDQDVGIDPSDDDDLDDVVEDDTDSDHDEGAELEDADPDSTGDDYDGQDDDGDTEEDDQDGMVDDESEEGDSDEHDDDQADADPDEDESRGDDDEDSEEDADEASDDEVEASDENGDD